MSLKDKIRFRNGKLKVMQISDLQDTKNTSVDTLRFVDDAIEKVRPDFIILTGDQLDVVGAWGKGEKAEKNVETAIRRLFSVIEKHNIPYVLTFGNHDRETGVSNEKQAGIYATLKNCICFDNINDGDPMSAHLMCLCVLLTERVLRLTFLLWTLIQKQRASDLRV